MEWMTTLGMILFLVQGFAKALALAFPGPWRALYYDHWKWPGRFQDPQLRRIAYAAESVGAAGHILMGASIAILILARRIENAPPYSAGVRVPGIVTLVSAVICWIAHLILNYILRRKQGRETSRMPSKETVLAYSAIALFLLTAIAISIRYGKDTFVIFLMLSMIGWTIFIARRTKMPVRSQMCLIAFLILGMLIIWAFGVAGALVFIAVITGGLVLHDIIVRRRQ